MAWPSEYDFIAYVSSGGIISGGIGSGSVGFPHMGSGSVLSGNIGSGQVGNLHLSSGSVTSGRLGITETPDGTKFLRDDFTWRSVAAGSLTSGAVQSGHVVSGTVGGFYGVTRHIQSGTVGSTDFGSGAVETGALGSGAVQSGNIASGVIGRFHIASGRLGGFELGSGAIVSGRIASGQIGNFHIGSGRIQGTQALSGAGVPNLASGTLNVFNFASGVVGAGLGISEVNVIANTHLLAQQYISTAETTTSTSPTWSLLTTPDEINNINIPTGTWKVMVIWSLLTRNTATAQGVRGRVQVDTNGDGDYADAGDETSSTYTINHTATNAYLQITVIHVTAAITGGGNIDVRGQGQVAGGTGEYSNRSMLVFLIPNV